MRPPSSVASQRALVQGSAGLACRSAGSRFTGRRGRPTRFATPGQSEAALAVKLPIAAAEQEPCATNHAPQRHIGFVAANSLPHAPARGAAGCAQTGQIPRRLGLLACQPPEELKLVMFENEELPALATVSGRDRIGHRRHAHPAAGAAVRSGTTAPALSEELRDGAASGTIPGTG